MSQAVGVVQDIGDADGMGEMVGGKETFVVGAVADGDDLVGGAVGKVRSQNLEQTRRFVLLQGLDVAMDGTVGESPTLFLTKTIEALQIVRIEVAVFESPVNQAESIIGSGRDVRKLSL